MCAEVRTGANTSSFIIIVLPSSCFLYFLLFVIIYQHFLLNTSSFVIVVHSNKPKPHKDRNSQRLMTHEEILNWPRGATHHMIAMSTSQPTWGKAQSEKSGILTQEVLGGEIL